jgi:hypothetical protein
VCFVDESQVLLTKLEHRFLSSTGENLPPSAFSAFLAAFGGIGTKDVGGFPVSALSIRAMEERVGPIMSKTYSSPQPKLAFADLTALSAIEVKIYLSSILTLDGMGGDLANHDKKNMEWW